MSAASFRPTLLTNIFRSCGWGVRRVTKGVVAKRIPIYIHLEKGKTYAWCTCGLSSKQPFCDGSHKREPSSGLLPLRFTVPESKKYLLCRCKQTDNRPYCDLSHVKTFVPESVRRLLNIKL